MLEQTMKSITILSLVTMCNTFYAEELLPNGTYLIDIKDTLVRALAKSQPNLSEKEMDERIATVKDGYNEMMYSYVMKEGSVDVLNKNGDVSMT